MRFALVALMLTLLCAPVAAADDLDTLVSWMTGRFDSAAQAAEDPDFFNIRLVMVPIWKERTDGRWLYVEQAAASAPDKPYRQRVYHVTALEDGSFSSAVYSFPDPLSRAGAWKEKAPLADLKPADLEVREGCAVILHKNAEGYFAGGTVDHDCVTTLRGASYATAEVMVKPTSIVSWDRGFDKDGNQVWGAEKGGYIFLRERPDGEVRRSPDPLEPATESIKKKKLIPPVKK